MAKQHGPAAQGQQSGTAALAELGDDQRRETAVEALAEKLIVAMAPSHGPGYTAESLADKAFTLAVVFYQERDKRRNKKRAQGGSEQGGNP